MFIVPITKMQPIGAIDGMGSMAGAGEASQSTSTVPFANFLKEAIDTTNELQAVSKQDAYDLAMGRIDNLPQMMINSSKATTAMELTVQITSKVINAYNQIMQTQI